MSIYIAHWQIISNALNIQYLVEQQKLFWGDGDKCQFTALLLTLCALQITIYYYYYSDGYCKLVECVAYWVCYILFLLQYYYRCYNVGDSLYCCSVHYIRPVGLLVKIRSCTDRQNWLSQTASTVITDLGCRCRWPDITPRTWPQVRIPRLVARLDKTHRITHRRLESLISGLTDVNLRT